MAFRGRVVIDHDRTDDEDGFFPTARNKKIGAIMGGVRAGDRRHKGGVPGGHAEAGDEEDEYPEIGRSDPGSQAPEGSNDSDGTTYEDEEGQSAGYTPEPSSAMDEDIEPKRPLRLTDRQRDRDVTPQEEQASGMAARGERSRLGNPKRAARGAGGHSKPPMGGRERFARLQETDDGDASAAEGLPRHRESADDDSDRAEGIPWSRGTQGGTETRGQTDAGEDLSREGRTVPPEHDGGGRSKLGNPKRAAAGYGGHAKPPLGSGQRFAQLKSKLAKRPGVSNPGALAAYIGRKKYGASKMAKMAAHNR